MQDTVTSGIGRYLVKNQGSAARTSYNRLKTPFFIYGVFIVLKGLEDKVTNTYRKPISNRQYKAIKTTDYESTIVFIQR